MDWWDRQYTQHHPSLFAFGTLKWQKDWASNIAPTMSLQIGIKFLLLPPKPKILPNIGVTYITYFKENRGRQETSYIKRCCDSPDSCEACVSHCSTFSHWPFIPHTPWPLPAFWQDQGSLPEGESKRSFSLWVVAVFHSPRQLTGQGSIGKRSPVNPLVSKHPSPQPPFPPDHQRSINSVHTKTLPIGSVAWEVQDGQRAISITNSSDSFLPSTLGPQNLHASQRIVEEGVLKMEWFGNRHLSWVISVK